MPIVTPAYPCMNSSYNVLASTLHIMMEEFQRGNDICEAIEENKADWRTLFEPVAFFEAYKNYLQIDISAANADDLRGWKGWVESCLGKLTLNRRRKGVPVNEGVPFDIRLTVEEFKQEVNIYMKRKPGMEISVSHVRRKNIPSFVFPSGVHPSRLEDTWDMKQPAEHRAYRSPESKAAINGSEEGGKKRVREERSDPNSENTVHVTAGPSPWSVETAEVSFTTMSAATSSHTMGYDLHGNGVGELGTKKSERWSREYLAVEKIAAVPYVGNQTLGQEVDELEDDLGCNRYSKEIPKDAK